MLYGQDESAEGLGNKGQDADFNSGGYGNQFSSHGRGGPPRSRGRGGPQGFDTPRGGGISGAPPGFSGPHAQRGRGGGLLGAGPPPGPDRGGRGPVPLMAMQFDDQVMEQRLGKDDKTEESE